jgi:hypothetical protein
MISIEEPEQRGAQGQSHARSGEAEEEREHDQRQDRAVGSRLERVLGHDVVEELRERGRFGHCGVRAETGP